ncbi:putative transcription factor B3-Domain family [Helianthus annuus]|nr:putative transcription factor B3-Domain family [Helianthus annuus]
MDVLTFRITHFKSYPHPDHGSKFHIVMKYPENQNLWVPRDFMQEHFNGDNLYDDFVIVFDKNHTWTVSMSRLWDMNHFFVDFTQVSNDLCLVSGDVIVFELVDQYVFKIKLFRTNGLQSLSPDLAVPVVESIKQEVLNFYLDRGFYILIADSSKSEQSLPLWYNKFDNLKGYPIGTVLMTNQEGNEWTVCVKSTANGYCFSNGWSAMVRDVGLEDNDVIVLHVVDDHKLKFTHFKADGLSCVKNKFYVKMLFPENANLWLPKEFMNMYFKADTLDDNFSIRFGSTYMWTIKVNRLWGSDYFIHDFSQITQDLHLISGDVIFFELVARRIFNIMLFRPNGIQSVFPEFANSVCVQEEEDTEQMDVSEDCILDTGNQDTEDEYVDVDPVPIFIADPVLEAGVVDVPHIPAVVDEGNVYELRWCLSFRFRIPKDFAANVDFSVLDEMLLQTEDGFSMTLGIRQETARGIPRYAFRGWRNFMLQAGLENGAEFLLRYFRDQNMLQILNPDH